MFKLVSNSLEFVVYTYATVIRENLCIALLVASISTLYSVPASQFLPVYPNVHEHT